jgi:NACalpha-BTF3-like transcription factor
MFMDEYDEEKIARLFRRDGYREALADLVRDGFLDVAIAAERAGVTEDEIRKAMEATK